MKSTRIIVPWFWSVLLAGGIQLVLLSTHATAQYRAKRILFNNDPSATVTGVDINNHGLVLAETYDYTYFTRAFLWDDGVSTLVSDETRTTTGESLNDAGEVAGWWSGYDGFVMRTDQTVRFGTPASIPKAISSQGDAFGRAFPAGGGTNEEFRAVALIDGIYQDMGIDFPGYGFAEATAVNSSNIAVGTMRTPNLHGVRAWQWREGEADLLQTRVPEDPNARSFAYSINDLGEIVGADYSDGVGGAAIWQGGQLAILPNVGTSYNDHSARDINNYSQIVGLAVNTAIAAPAPVVWESDGDVFNLNDVTKGIDGWYVYSATAINDSGQILIDAVLGSPDNLRIDGSLRSVFVLTPIPEPSRVAVLFGGLGMIGLSWTRLRYRDR